jgi:uncharacterized integral membrane protein (TIGR00697 family)
MFKIEKMDLLVAVYIFCIIVAELMGAKTFPLIDLGFYKLNASVSIFLIPLLFTINDVVVEVYGKARARSIVRSGLFTIGLLFVFIMLAINLPPSMRFMESEASYDEIFGKSARITLASLTAFALADFMDIYIFSRIREKFGTSKLWLRNNLSNFIAQLIDTVIFMSLAFYAINEPFGENVAFLFSLIFPYWLLKCSMSIIETPFVYVGVKWLKGSK